MRFILSGYIQFHDVSPGHGIFYVLEKKLMVPLFYTQNIMQIIGLKIFYMRCAGTQGILIDNELQVWMVLAQFADKTPDCVTFTIHLGLAVLFSDGLRRQNYYLFMIMVDNSRTDRLQIIGHLAAFFISFFHTAVGMPGDRGKIAGAVKIEEVAAFHENKFLKYLTAL